MNSNDSNKPQVPEVFVPTTRDRLPSLEKINGFMNSNRAKYQQKRRNERHNESNYERLCRLNGISLKQWKEYCGYYDNRCVCCGQKKKLTMDHIIPLSQGGKACLSNLQPMCGPCNTSKGQMSIDYRPRFHKLMQGFEDE